MLVGSNIPITRRDVLPHPLPELLQSLPLDSADEETWLAERPHDESKTGGMSVSARGLSLNWLLSLLP